MSRSVYSVDASIYEVEPMGVILPKTKEDIVNTIRIAGEKGISIIPRGAGTGITGGCIGEGIIIDVSKYLRSILTVNFDEEYVICEPGVIQDQLNDALRVKGYRLGPDTSTGNRATLGGMLANNAAGSRSLKYGQMVDHVLSVELALASGELMRFDEIGAKTWEKKCLQEDTEGTIYRKIKSIREKYGDEIKSRFPKIPRRVSGYNLNELVKPQPLNVSKLIAGSEGTLGIVTEITMNISKIPRDTGLCILHFDDMIQGILAIETILTHNPIAVEMLDDKVLAMGKMSPRLHNKLSWLVGEPETVFIVELEGIDSLHDFVSTMKKRNIGYAQVTLTDAEEMSHVWEVRKAGLELLLSKRSYNRAIAFIEDISLAPQQLPHFMEAFQNTMKKFGRVAGIYGHVGSGCMHIRPYIDMRKRSELQLMEHIIEDVSKLLLEHEGALSGEHGDGLVRSWTHSKMFGKKIYEAFVELKEAFDPDNLMNPGKIVHPAPFLNNLRLSPETTTREMSTFLDFTKEGGFALAADLCNGNARCRKTTQTMCPSFQVSGDEYDTTRSRAQALRSIIHGRLPPEEFAGEGLHEVLDLCIGCKGCKAECPSQVDMAKMKAEVLYQYQEKHGYAVRDFLFGHIGKVNRLSSPFATLFNRLGGSSLAKFLLSRMGVTPERDLPHLAKQRFSQWFRHQNMTMDKNKTVVLFNDTFTEFHTPEIGISATKILQALGYTIILPPWQCCGRTLISKGMLKPAKTYANNLLKTFKTFAEKQIPIIGLEPSCILTIKDDFQGLLGCNNDVLNKVIAQCQTFDEFLASHIENNILPLPFSNEKRYIKVHGHCHQKALIGTQPTLQVLQTLPNTRIFEIPTGCCGMAGSFGYEKEHYNFSMKIGELHLFPNIRQSPPNTIFITNGFSCRSHILHGTDRHAQHLAEVLCSALNPEG